MNIKDILIVISRGKTLIEDHFDNSPELEERLAEGRRQYREGNVTTCTTKEELNKFLEAL